MVRTRKAPHVVPNLSQDDFGGAPAHARNGIAQHKIRFRLVAPLLECGRESFNRLVQIVHMAEMLCEEKGMMGPPPSDQRLFERGESDTRRLPPRRHWLDSTSSGRVTLIEISPNC